MNGRGARGKTLSTLGFFLFVFIIGYFCNPYDFKLTLSVI